MAFDKIKAMRSAERYLAQGKIRAAISEYQDVVVNDPADYGTINLLGDLLSKAEEPKAAVKCYTTVAEHYSKQGFAQKAIAVYNKISKIQPNSLGVSEKLADLYRQKGSVKEAKSHYVVLAENYQAKGRVTEALAMWKQIALLDPQNTEVYLTIANAYQEAGETHESVEALADAGKRFATCGLSQKALETFWSGIERDPTNLRCLGSFVEVAFEIKCEASAVGQLSTLLKNNAGLIEVQTVLVDAYIRMEDAERAESCVLKLVEQDPTQHPKLLDLANFYIYRSDLDSACRILNVASEHLLQSGRAEEFAAAVRVILESEPEQLDAIRLLVRFCTWQKDEAELKEALIRLAEIGGKKGFVEDERFALSQLVLYFPHERAYAERLLALNAENGFEDGAPVEHSLFDQTFFKRAAETKGSSSEAVTATTADHQVVAEGGEPVHEATIDAAVVTESIPQTPAEKLAKESDSVRFYVDSGYHELAERAIAELEAEFGSVPEVESLKAYLSSHSAIIEPPPVETNGNGNGNGTGKLFDLGEFSKELGLEEAEAPDDGDFETKYQTAIAYQEMGLLEQAISEFQDAAGRVRPNDGTRRFFNCANLLGHCFMESGMPKLAAKWFERALEIQDLTGDEKQALWYELGLVYEAEDNSEDAGRYFEQVYAENVDFRDVRERLRKMAVVSG